MANREMGMQLAWAFELVTAGMMENWKGPISRTIPANLRDQVAAAIEHFSGSEATFEAEGASGAYLRVRAAGYHAACGA